MLKYVGLFISINIAGIIALYAQKKLAPDIYMVQFTNKNFNEYSIDKPEEFLSPRAIARRQKHNLSILENDLPVSKIYVDSLKNAGYKIYNVSKWLNAATIQISDESQLQQLKNFSFIVHNLSQQKSAKVTLTPYMLPQKLIDTVTNEQLYGNSLLQIAINKGEYLHNSNYKGQGMLIAVLDGGFGGIKEFSSLQKLWDEKRVILQRDFADTSNSSFGDFSHGSNVLSIMAGNKEGSLVGSAPDASYALIRTEDAHIGENGMQYEYPVEEFNWIVGAELADSIGADIINSSLGYSQFNDPVFNYTYQQMDGKTAISTQGANIAFSKGMVVVVSAGNEGNKPWYYITAPSDGENILCTGAINASLQLAPFSSRGPSYDNRVKPDIVAMGQGTWIQNGSEIFIPSNGTSFSAPIISGLTACLWQANPTRKNSEIISAIRKSASLYKNPNEMFGYGIANFQKADSLLKNLPHFILSADNILKVYPNPFSSSINIEFWIPLSAKSGTISIFNANGKLVEQLNLFGESGITNYINLTNLANKPKGLYIIKYVTGNYQKKLLIAKQ